MSTLPRFLAKLVGRLDRCGIRYMITGSLCGVFHGESRTSGDVDLVIDCGRDALEAFIALAADDSRVSWDEAREALARRARFAFVDLETGWKADMIFLRDRPYSREEFGRRRRAGLPGLSLCVVSPEDAILSKLEFSKETKSEQQARDVAGIWRAQRGSLDVVYLRRWARELGVQEEMERVIGS